jgi:uncharacterized protein (DUF433 family)
MHKEPLPRRVIMQYIEVMTTLEEFDRITFDPAVMGGKACIRGMRVTVSAIIDQVAAGRTLDQVLADYPYLERADVMQSLQYAAYLVSGERAYELETAIA